MSQELDYAFQEINRLQCIVLEAKKDFEKLKRSLAGYKGWRTRYKRKNEELKFVNNLVCKQRDQALKELSLKQVELLKSLQEGQQAKKDRDKAISKLDEIITKLEKYQRICETKRENDTQGSDYLLQEAERLFFREEIEIEIKLDRRDSPQMFTDRASINRSLLDR